jgi:hypothetical protein
MTTVNEEIDKQISDKVAFISFIIPEFALACKMNIQDAYLYLKRYGGLDYLYRHWWALHTDTPCWAIDSLFNICRYNGGFCTTVSIQEIEDTDNRPEWNIEHIGNDIIKQIIRDKNTDETEATDFFFTSQTFAALSDATVELYLKPWQEIYAILKKESKT